MLFHSTRGGDNKKTFEQVLMQGLAKDGGLFMPDFWPKINIEDLKNIESFVDVAKYIVPLFTDSSFNKDEVEKLLDQTWHDFDKKELINIFEINEKISILELFHGPTSAFKDLSNLLIRFAVDNKA